MVPFCENVAAAKDVNVAAAELVVPADLCKCVFGDDVFGEPTIAVNSIIAKI